MHDERSGLCGCGCGQRTELAPRTRARSGWVKGQPKPYVRGHHGRKGQRHEIDANGCWVWQLCRDARGYGHLGADGRSWLAHRWYWTERHGPIPAGLVLDHLCHNPSCVNPEHLRLVTQRENSQNRKGANTGGTSSLRGVWRGTRKWHAKAVVDGVPHYLGSFDAEDAAHEAVAAFRRVSMPGTLA